MNDKEAKKSFNTNKFLEGKVDSYDVNSFMAKKIEWDTYIISKDEKPIETKTREKPIVIKTSEKPIETKKTNTKSYSIADSLCISFVLPSVLLKCRKYKKCRFPVAELFKAPGDSWHPLDHPWSHHASVS